MSNFSHVVSRRPCWPCRPFISLKPERSSPSLQSLCTWRSWRSLRSKNETIGWFVRRGCEQSSDQDQPHQVSLESHMALLSSLSFAALVKQWCSRYTFSSMEVWSTHFDYNSHIFPDILNIEIALSNLTGSPEGPDFPGFPFCPWK